MGRKRSATPDSLEGLYTPDPYDAELASVLRERATESDPTIDDHVLDAWVKKTAISLGHLVGAVEFTSGIDTVFELGEYSLRFLDVRANPLIARE